MDLSCAKITTSSPLETHVCTSTVELCALHGHGCGIGRGRRGMAGYHLRPHGLLKWIWIADLKSYQLTPISRYK